MTRYTTPGQFRSAVKQHARNLARETNANPAVIAQSYYFRCLAARVFRHDPDGWLLKGGQALLVRYPGEARLSRDIDLQRAANGGAQQAVAALLAAVQQSLGPDDHLTFTLVRQEDHADGYKGARLTFQVLIGTAVDAHITADVVTGRETSVEPEKVSLTSGLRIPWPEEWPTARLYPLPDHVADKICAVYERHGEYSSNRYRDLADLLLISQRDTLEGATALHALTGEIARRRALGIVLEPSAPFTAPSSDWETGYPKSAADVAGLRGCSTLAEAVEEARRFLDPLLDGSVTGRWDPAAQTWQ